MKDVRFIEAASYQKGSIAANNEFDSLLYNQMEFTKYVKANHFPFKNKFYKLNSGTPLDKLDEDQQENFFMFLAFLKVTYKIDINLSSTVAHETLNLTDTLNQSFMNESHKRFNNILSRYGPRPKVAVMSGPESENYKN